jgi:hypothetical protein
VGWGAAEWSCSCSGAQQWSARLKNDFLEVI